MLLVIYRMENHNSILAENGNGAVSEQGRSALIFLGTGCSSALPNTMCLLQPSDPPCQVCFPALSIPPNLNPNYRFLFLQILHFFFLLFPKLRSHAFHINSFFWIQLSLMRSRDSITLNSLRWSIRKIRIIM